MSLLVCRLLSIVALLVVAVEPSFAQSRRRLKPSGPDLVVLGGASAARFGTVKPSTVRRTIAIVNRGSDTLRVFGIDDSCGCITRTLDRDTIPPGDTGRFEITLSLQNRFGKFSRPIIIRSNDRRDSAAQLSVSATVYRPVTVLPQSGVVYDGDTCRDHCSLAFEVRNTGRRRVKIEVPAITSVYGMALRFSLDSAVWLRPGASIKLYVFVSLTESDAYAETRIRTSSPEAPVVQLPIYARKGR